MSKIPFPIGMRPGDAAVIAAVLLCALLPLFVRGDREDPQALTVRTAEESYRYVLPQQVRLADRDVSLFMRVTQPFGKCRLVVQSGDAVLATANRLKAAPGEMEKITVRADKLTQVTGPITVRLEELK